MSIQTSFCSTFLLYFIGELNRNRITRFKRTKQFTPKDYDLLVDFLRNFATLATTPNILTEVNSLINQLGEPERSACYEIFARKVDSLQESYLSSQSIASLNWSFFKYGLTDCGIDMLARDRYLVLTDDLKLFTHLSSKGIDT